MNISEDISTWWFKKYYNNRNYDFQSEKGKLEMLINFLDFYKIKYKISLKNSYKNNISYLTSILIHHTFFYFKVYTLSDKVIRFYGNTLKTAGNYVLNNGNKTIHFTNLKEAINKYKSILKRNKTTL